MLWYVVLATHVSTSGRARRRGAPARRRRACGSRNAAGATAWLLMGWQSCPVFVLLVSYTPLGRAIKHARLPCLRGPRVSLCVRETRLTRRNDILRTHVVRRRENKDHITLFSPGQGPQLALVDHEVRRGTRHRGRRPARRGAHRGDARVQAAAHVAREERAQGGREADWNVRSCVEIKYRGASPPTAQS